MNVTVIAVVVLLALFDIAMLVMCSHMEDRHGYYHEKHLKEQTMRNPCKECDYYHEENNICQTKKCSAHGGDGTVTRWDRLFCEPYKRGKGPNDEQVY